MICSGSDLWLVVLFIDLRIFQTFFCVLHCCVSLSSTTKNVHEAHVKAFDVLRECYKVLVTVLVNHLNVSHKNFSLYSMSWTRSSLDTAMVNIEPSLKILPQSH